jgi:CheY-like chemotaxis protein
MKEIVQAAIDVTRPVAEARGVELAVELQSDLLVNGDPDRLQQVVWNLLSNAVKFTSAGGRVHVTVERINEHVQIRVSDTGAGIDPAFLRFVFDRFRQADSTTTRTHGGLGIGLTIVRHIVEMHGGTVSAHSAGLRQGACFTVMLPMSPPRAAAAILPPGDQADPHTPVTLSGKRVLLIDDEADAREMLTEILRRADADVVAASSVREAFESLAVRLPDILVSDIGMPGEDGFDLIHTLRKLPAERGGSTPAVALTAYARDEDRLRVLRAGFQLHLAKPVEPRELLTALARLTRRADAQEIQTPANSGLHAPG